jgi:DNA-binding MarR family transcriptional regulator
MAGNEQIIKDIVGAIRRLVRAVYLDSAKMSKQFGLTAAQSQLLNILATKGPLSSADLSRNLYVTPSNITGIVDRLERKGLVERIRKQEDRRVILIALTENGHQLSRHLPDPIESKLITGIVDLEPEYVRNLSEALTQILQVIGVGAIEMEEAPLDLESKDSTLVTHENNP